MPLTTSMIWCTGPARSGSGFRRDLHGGVVGADQHRILPCEPFSGSRPDAGADALVARVVLAPQRAPAGVNQHGVAGLQRQLLRGQRVLQVLRRDLVGLGQRGHAFERGNVDEHAARHERPDLFDPELREPVRLAADSSVTQLYMLVPIIWWLKVSNCVPTCPISETTSSSFDERRCGQDRCASAS
jgi:hypothetical protein